MKNFGLTSFLILKHFPKITRESAATHSYLHWPLFGIVSVSPLVDSNKKLAVDYASQNKPRGLKLFYLFRNQRSSFTKEVLGASLSISVQPQIIQLWHKVANVVVRDCPITYRPTAHDKGRKRSLKLTRAIESHKY